MKAFVVNLLEKRHLLAAFFSVYIVRLTCLSTVHMFGMGHCGDLGDIGVKFV